MNPRDIFDYKCSSCRAMWEPQYFGWNCGTGARLKTCNFCRAIRAARAEVRRATPLEQIPELTPEPVLWDAAAEADAYTEVDTEMDNTVGPIRFVSHYAETTADSNDSREMVGPVQVVTLVYSSDSEIKFHPFASSSSAAAVDVVVSYFCDEPEPEPPADFPD
jgi:hypothetical protein